MDCSVNEIESTIRKAVVGAGYTTGVAQDLSRACGWLCAQGIDGADLLLEVLNKPVTKPNVALLDSNIYRFKDMCILSCGVSVLDILIAEFERNASENSESQVHLSNVDAPLLLIGLAANAMKESKVTIEILLPNDKAIVLSPSSIKFDVTDLDSGIDVVLRCIRSKTMSQNEGNAIRENEQKSVSISETTIHLLNTYAAKTYVPATEASRLAGAGAGLTDND